MTKTLRRRWRFVMGAVVLTIAVVFGLYACATRSALQREIANTPRDAATGVVLGTEALSLDPPNGDTPTSACLLLHGWAGSRKDFSDLGERLAAAGFHVRMARLAGHGTTPVEFREQTPQSMYASALAEYRALRDNYKEVTVIGFSMGGSLATLLASHEDVDRLVLVAPYYGVTYQWYYVLPAEAWNALAGWALPYVIRSEGMIRVNRPGAAKDIYSYRVIPTRAVGMLVELGKQARRTETLSAITCPVLLVMAEGDMASGPARARRAFDTIGSANKIANWYPKRSNHHLLSDYDGESAKEAILEFMADVGEIR